MHMTTSRNGLSPRKRKHVVTHNNTCINYLVQSVRLHLVCHETYNPEGTQGLGTCYQSLQFPCTLGAWTFGLYSSMLYGLSSER